MTKAIRLHAHGGPDMLQWESVPMPKPGKGEILIHHKAVGLNYIDIYHRTGLYPVREFPAILGYEGAGVVEKLGEGCETFQVGDRVAYALGPMGAYANYRVIEEKHCIKLPDDITPELAAGLMLKGLTAYMLLRRAFYVTKGMTILVHAAAGGVGLLLCQWARHLGVTVIGTVGSEEKAQMARDNGCDFPILYQQENVVEKVREITGGKGVNAVYDSVGKDTFLASLDCLCRFGILVSFGQSSGKVPPFDIGLLQQKGSLFLTRPTLMDYKADQAQYLIACNEMFTLVEKGVLRVNIGQSYWLQDAARAHRELEQRQTTGSTILLVH